jgi:hypothetical protein
MLPEGRMAMSEIANFDVPVLLRMLDHVANVEHEQEKRRGLIHISRERRISAIAPHGTRGKRINPLARNLNTVKHLCNIFEFLH